jgi:hypothetical protein
MTKRDPKVGHGSRRRARAGSLLVLSAACAVGLLAIVPASAGLEVPPLPPLPLPTLTPVQEPVTSTVGGLLEAPDQILGNTGGGPSTGGTTPKTGPVNTITNVDSWTLDELPALRGTAERTDVSSTQLDRPGSYSSMVAGGLKRAAGRAADLARPLAAPLALALFAVGLLAIAARGPGRLVKVEEERQIYRERRTYRL